MCFLSPILQTIAVNLQSANISQDRLLTLFLVINRQYFTIASHDQRSQYKQDFNTEYEEYRHLHEKIDNVAKKFLDLQLLRKQTPRDSLEFEVLVFVREYWQC